MNKTQEALKMAIEAMAEFEWTKDSKYKKAIQACKEALAQPAQEPIKDHCVHLGIDICKNKGVCKYCSPPKIDLPRLNHYNADFTRCGIQHKGKMYLFVADTHPAPSWQGLSDDDMTKLCDKYWDSENGHSIKDIITMVEQALKEKNA